MSKFPPFSVSDVTDARRFFKAMRLLLCLGLLSPLPMALAAPDAAPATSESAAPESAPVEIRTAAKVYSTNIPRSFALQYQIQRGGVRGHGEMRWTKTGDSYEASLKGYVAGFTVLNWASRGGFDHAGIAPALYAEHRLGKSDRDVTFDRDDTRISFSGTRNEDIALPPGAQDRLSWLVQLPAILTADAKRARAGTKLTLFVVGTKGRASDWVFESAGPETIRLPGGVVNSVKWVREAPDPDDTQAEVWLDPSRHYAPVRVRLTAAASEAPLELTLVDSTF
ncbi:DUF3108 domain-containing protein [Xylophilus sp. GOD-11R]|uniref:DUF3108 domain-containing protein n=1 Tax=Xylophilus sp. GOD-11R TaxID=3089814 RepID=UPI00298CECEE|nr:DUF3108 domain-containing protein [Xylophilus sp. GOD-11R]WPB58950.1 DUF3108 domain-containing protein [Xylophilus sp. GOD-11R]